MCTDSWSFQEREGLYPSHPLLPILLAGIWEYWWKIEALSWWLLLLLLLSSSVMSNSLQPHGLQHVRLPVLHYHPEFAQTHVHWVDNSIQPSCPLLSPSPPALTLSSIRVFSNKSALCIRWPKYWNFSISLPNEYWGLISFRIYWFDLLAVQRSLKSLPQHHNSKHQFFSAHPSFLSNYTSTQDSWKNHRFDYMDLCQQSDITVSNTLSSFVKAFIPRNKRLLISWLQSLTTVILEPKKIKFVTVSTFPPSICQKVKGLDAMILDFWMLSFKPAFLPSSFTLIKRLFSFSSLSAIRVVSSVYLRLLIFLPAILIPD